MNKKAPQGDAPLDLLYAELVRATGSDKENSILDICISGKQKEIASVPLRYRLIALGFVKKLSPEEVNDRLLENGCPRLYARSFWEASVIYALRKGLSYVQWKDLLAQCEDLRAKIVPDTRISSSKSISLSDIRAYVEGNSSEKAGLNATMHVTKEIKKELAALASGNEGGQDSGQAEFLEFLRSNIESFSTVREKARYYFCKYLLHDLERRKRAYLDYMEKELARKKARNGKNTAGFPSDPVLIQDLHVFHSLSSLERKQRTIEEADEILENAFLSMRKIYKSYSNFYFDYPFRNWKMILAENGTDPLALDPDQKKALADAVRREENKKKSKHDSDADLLARLQKEFQDLEGQEPKNQMPKDQRSEEEKTSYQSGRQGEHFLRKVLRGTLDLDRTTLLSFLLYFRTTAMSEIPEAHRIDKERLNVILEGSGFPVLDPALPFDRFVCDFLESRDPWDLLAEEAEQMALSGKNFYLHRAWLHSVSMEREWGEVT